MSTPIAPNISGKIHIAGLDDEMLRDGAIKDEATLIRVFESHFGFESGIEALERFRQVGIVAAHGEGSFGIHANQGAPRKDAYEEGTQELNRMLKSLGWKTINTKHKKVSISRERGILILYKNVKKACYMNLAPKGISKCGPETTDLVCSNSNNEVGSCSPLEVWFLCVEVGNNGEINIELSLPKPYLNVMNGFHCRMIIESNRNDTLDRKPQISLDDSLDDEIDEPSVELM